jgi:hypothetical protein
LKQQASEKAMCFCQIPHHHPDHRILVQQLTDNLKVGGHYISAHKVEHTDNWENFHCHVKTSETKEEGHYITNIKHHDRSKESKKLYALELFMKKFSVFVMEVPFPLCMFS